MLDIAYIRENQKEVRDNIRNRGLTVDLDRFIEIDKKRSDLIMEIDEARSNKNKFKNKPSRADLAKLTKNKEKIEKKEAELKKIETEYFKIYHQIPNVTHPDVKISNDEKDNPVLSIPVKPRSYRFPVKDHLQLAEELDLIDFERGAKVSGAKFYYLKNDLALIDIALIQYALEIVTKYGFVPVVTPDLARKEVLEGLGFSPRDESTQIYNIEDSDLSLIGTAEITMGGYHMNEVLPETDLPKKYVAVSHCFRTEAGSYSKYSKGIFRVHQFSKVEMFVYTTPDKSEEAHQEILKIEEEIYKGLDLPYRVIDHCTADLGSPASRTYDLEAWMPGKPNENGGLGDWAEITSTSNCTDYQSRGLNIKYLDNNGEKRYLHMLNGTAIADARTLIALIENNQREDGSIEIPKSLQKWIGRKLIKKIT